MLPGRVADKVQVDVLNSGTNKDEPDCKSVDDSDSVGNIEDEDIDKDVDVGL